MFASGNKGGNKGGVKLKQVPIIVNIIEYYAEECLK